MHARKWINTMAIAATATVLLGATVNSSASADTNCGSALVALADAQNAERGTADQLAQAQKSDDAAQLKQHTAVTTAQSVFHTWRANNRGVSDADIAEHKKTRNDAISAADAEYTNNGTAGKLQVAQANETAAQGVVSSKSAAADTACTGPAGAPGAPGKNGNPGRPGPQGNPGLPGKNGKTTVIDVYYVPQPAATPVGEAPLPVTIVAHLPVTG